MLVIYILQHSYKPQNIRKVFHLSFQPPTDGWIEVTFSFPDQEDSTAYLEDNRSGRVLLELFKSAFKRRLIFQGIDFTVTLRKDRVRNATYAPLVLKQLKILGVTIEDLSEIWPKIPALGSGPDSGVIEGVKWN